MKVPRGAKPSEGPSICTACAQHTRWIRAAKPSVRVQHCFHSPRRHAGGDLPGKRQEWGHPENNNKEPSFREQSRRNNSVAPLTLSVTGSNEPSIEGLLQCPGRPARLHEAEGDERVF